MEETKMNELFRNEVTENPEMLDPADYFSSGEARTVIITLIEYRELIERACKAEAELEAKNVESNRHFCEVLELRKKLEAYKA
jgi:hypothetical protein